MNISALEDFAAVVSELQSPGQKLSLNIVSFSEDLPRQKLQEYLSAYSQGFLRGLGIDEESIERDHIGPIFRNINRTIPDEYDFHFSESRRIGVMEIERYGSRLKGLRDMDWDAKPSSRDELLRERYGVVKE